MKSKFIILIIIIFSMNAGYAQQQIECWDRFELSCNGTPVGNQFTDVSFKATFTCNEESIQVNGFYDGSNTYKIRFMPLKTGIWSYITESNMNALNKKTGWFECIRATDGNHGMVKVRDTISLSIPTVLLILRSEQLYMPSSTRP